MTTSKDRIDIVKCLNGNQGAKTDVTSLYLAAKENYPDLVQLSIYNGADTNRLSHEQYAHEIHIENQTTLLVACMISYRDVIRCLTNMIYFTYGQTTGRAALFYACSKGVLDIVEYFIEQDVDTNEIEKVNI